MFNSSKSRSTEDQHDLIRFVEAQDSHYLQALAEIDSGVKRTHWMWYIFPQIDGLAFSSKSKRNSIKSAEEAKAFFNHPILGPRLIECMETVLRVEGRSAAAIFGSPDDLNLRSCASLFASLSPPDSVFERVLDKYYQGGHDEKTFQLLGTDSRIRPAAGEPPNE
jgi:uncharacterized protein (DUF1810 family)